jgi:hypothetical protein
MKQYLKTTETATVNNYPYGRLQATVTFSLEFDKKKGFRTVFQSINPKNGRLNAPKKSTYGHLIVQTNTDGFISSEHHSFNGVKEMNKACKFIAENFDLFTPEQIEYFYIMALAYSKVSMKAAHIYTGASIEALKPIFEPAIKAAMEGCNTKANTFDKIVIDEQAYEATKDPNFEPFVTTTFTIGA